MYYSVMYYSVMYYSVIIYIFKMIKNEENIKIILVYGYFFIVIWFG